MEAYNSIKPVVFQENRDLVGWGTGGLEGSSIAYYGWIYNNQKEPECGLYFHVGGLFILPTPRK